MSLLERRRAALSHACFYAIVDTGYAPLERIPEITRLLVEGGVDLIQLRAKKLPPSAVVALAQSMRAAIPATGPLFILNDHPELVSQVGADGIHVGQDDLPVSQARAQAGLEAVVGKSTHSLEQAVVAEKEGSDYIGVGPIFATLTKPDYLPVGLGLIGQVRDRVQVPQFCIGGVNELTLASVLQAGARRIVIVSDLLQSADILAYCQRIRSKLPELPK